MEKRLETSTRQCGLIEYCGDFHVIGKEACEGLKSYNGCPLFIEQRDNQYNDRHLPIGL